MIRSAAVLGAGTMGAQLAAHLANAGLEVSLLDLTQQLAAEALARLGDTRPLPFFSPEIAARVRTGSFDEDRAHAARADWVVEAVVESLAVKRDVIARISRVVDPRAVVSSNTSAIPLREIAADLPDAFRRRWLGTHFFNPPRYQPLVELVPTDDTDPAVVRDLGTFLEVTLGKQVVVARDTPGFIANRLGMFAAARAIAAWASGEFTIEEVEAATRLLTGARTGVLRATDFVGLDVVASVAGDLARRLPGHGYEVPRAVDRMIDAGRLGRKTGRGFYARDRSRGEAWLGLDPISFEYRALDGTSRVIAPDAGATPDTARRLMTDSGRSGDLARRTLGATLVYAAVEAPALAPSIDDVDRAMRWGFGWQLGPFELWDAIGLRAVLEAMRVDAPPIVRAALDRGHDALRDAPLPPRRPELLCFTQARRAGAIVESRPEASLVDLGDGVFGLELHAKANVLGRDALDLLRAALARAAADGVALVAATEAEHFSAGADLRVVLEESRRERWTILEALVREFQDAMLAVKTSAVPVVIAPRGMTLGGGCELCLHASRLEAAAETYLGLPEAGVGLIPAGGGTKEMLIRAGAGPDAGRAIAATFATIASAAVSTSAHDARRLGYLTAADGITMHRDRVIVEAKAAALALGRDFRPRSLQDAVPVAGAALYDRLMPQIEESHRRAEISAHDALVGRKLAHVMSGGRTAGRLSEHQLLQLEREAFLSLCGEPKTLERIAYTLKTGRPLRN